MLKLSLGPDLGYPPPDPHLRPLCDDNGHGHGDGHGHANKQHDDHHST